MAQREAEIAEDGIAEETAASGPKLSARGRQRRQEILAAAMRIYGRDGYDNAALASVAREVGLTLPGLLHYFPSKVDLLLAILEERDSGLTGGCIDPRTGWRELLDKLRQINRANLDLAVVVRAFSILNAESLTEGHPAAIWFRDRARHVAGQIAAPLAAAQARGEIRSSPPASEIAAELIALWDGVQVLWLRDPGRFDMVGIFETYLARLEADLAQGGASGAHDMPRP